MFRCTEMYNRQPDKKSETILRKITNFHSSGLDISYCFMLQISKEENECK